MRLSVLMVTLLASPLPALAATAPPSPTPAIIGVKADGGREVVRVALLGFVEKKHASAPDVLRGQLYYGGQAAPVALHLKWRETDDNPGAWVAADYWLDAPKGATGDAVLSLDSGKQGWSFRLGEM